MGSFKLSRPWTTTALSEAWLGTTVTGRPVVAHSRRAPWASAASFISRYAATARGWQGLRQPGVVPLVEVGQSAGAVWVVEEFIEGEPLRALLQAARGPLSPLEATALVTQLARGLSALSRLIPSLFHGDVCPGSAVVGVDGDARLGLVGVAASHEADSALGPARAELPYLAPEELSDDRGSATDVFRLGLLWLESLSGKTVFSGATFAEVKARLAKYPGLTPQHFSNFPPGVAQLLASMLAKSPRDRPPLVEVEATLADCVRKLGGSDDVSAPVARAFARLFPGRVPVLRGLSGTEPLLLNPLPSAPSSPPTPFSVGHASADGAVTLAKVAPRRVTSEQMALVRATEAADAARAAAAEWHARHAQEPGRPKDFQLGVTLLERQRITVSQADAALQHSQSFGSTLLEALAVLGILDEDDALPLQAELLKQRCLTIQQLLELDVSRSAALLPQDVAERWMVLPLQLEAGGLAVAIADPGRLDALDDVKRRAKVRSVIALRATERTIQEGLLRVYAGKTARPEWLEAQPRPEATAPLRSLDPSTLPPLPEVGDLELDLPPLSRFEPLPPPSGSPAALTSTQLSNLPPMPVERAPAQTPSLSPPRPKGQPTAPLRGDTASLLDLAGRLLDALFSLVPERGAEAARLVALVCAVARRSGASGHPLEQVRLTAKALVIAALLEKKRPFETPSLPSVAAVLSTSFKELEPFLRPLLERAERVSADPRTVVLMVCFELCAQHGGVPEKLADCQQAIASLRPRFPAPAIAALEAVLGGTW